MADAAPRPTSDQLLKNKLERLLKAQALETGASEKFKLEYEIQETRLLLARQQPAPKYSSYLSGSLSPLTSAAWRARLPRRLRKLSGPDADYYWHLADSFQDPQQLLKYYVEPSCQDTNPPDLPPATAAPENRQPAFARIDRFLTQD